MGSCMGKKKKAKSSEVDKGKGTKITGFMKLKGKRDKSEEAGAAHYVVDKADFTNKLKEAGNNLVVVDFFATWCGPCKLIKPKVEELAEEMKADNIIFLKVDVDECEEVTSDYSVSSMPTFVLIKNSEKVEEMSGVNLDRLRELIKNNK